MYGIMRMEKVKTSAELAARLKHNLRERMPPNADPEITKKNLVLKNGQKTAVELEREIISSLPEKRRKDAVLAIEAVFTRSSDKEEFVKDYESRYHKDCIKWAEDTFGKENIKHIVVHLDEAVPHLHVIFTPVFDGRLRAKQVMNKKNLRKLQDDFYAKVSSKYGLDRGEKRQRTRVTMDELRTITKKILQSAQPERLTKDEYFGLKSLQNYLTLSQDQRTALEKVIGYEHFFMKQEKLLDRYLKTLKKTTQNEQGF